MMAVTIKSVTNPVIIIGFSSWNSSRRYKNSNSKTNNRTDDMALEWIVHTTPTVPFDDRADLRLHFSDMSGNKSLLDDRGELISHLDTFLVVVYE